MLYFMLRLDIHPKFRVYMAVRRNDMKCPVINALYTNKVESNHRPRTACKVKRRVLIMFQSASELVPTTTKARY